MKRISAVFYLCILVFSCGRSAEDLLKEALVLENQGRYTDAIKILDQAIQKDSTYIGAYINRGADKSALKLYEDAIRDYKIVLKYDPNNSLALFNIGNNLKRTNNFEESLKYYDRALGFDENSNMNIRFESKIQIDPFFVPADDIHYERGLAYYELKLFESAYLDFANISNENQTAEVQYMIGASALNLGNDQIGCNALRGAIQFGYEGAKSVYNKYCK